MSILGTDRTEVDMVGSTLSRFKINIVYQKDGWILPQIAANLANEIVCCGLSETADPEADINLYVNYHLFSLLGSKKTNFDVGFFTHKEPAGSFDQIASSLDHCIGMSLKTYDLLPRNKRSVLSPMGADTELFKNKELTIGVVARDYPGGRKVLEILHKLSEINGVINKVTGGRLDKNQLVDFYDSIDYMLVTSTLEGGPIPVLESLLLNKPIIAPDVGWCWDFPVVKYSSYNELVSIISKLASPIKSWKDSANELVKILEEAYEGKQK